jgi:20S proteasome subunit beta 6
MDVFNYAPSQQQHQYQQNVSKMSSAIKKPDWSPYEMNGGSVMAIAGETFAVIASDTRLSEGYSILSRENPHLYELENTNKCILACSGFHGDTLTFAKVLQTRLKMYEYEHNKKASTGAIAQLISTMLYNKRFFPYYVNPIIAGLDEQGRGAIYSYDPVGSFDREIYRSSGSSVALLQPLLDSQLGMKNQSEHFEIEKGCTVSQNLEKCLQLVKDAFTSAAERDIYTGDAVLIKVITKDGVKTERFALRRD